MAASVEQWFCEELSKLGIDATEDNAQYILSMDDAEDLEQYMLSLLDGSDPAVREFIPRLMEQWYAMGGKPPPNATVYKKADQTQVYIQPKGKKKKDRNKNKATNPSNGQEPPVASMSTSATTVSDGKQGSESPRSEEKAMSTPMVNGASPQPVQDKVANGQLVGGEMLGQGAKKKSKFVPLYSKQGNEKLVIKLPGRTQCECQALKHKLVSNCTHCGRVVCEQEGAGPCLFCGRLVCNPEDQEILSRGSKKSEKLRQHLMRDADKFTPLCRGGGEREMLSSVSTRMQEGLQKAQKHKDRLLEYDKTSAKRTQVIDDECDYFSTDSNRWLSNEDREALRKRDEELRSIRFASRKDRKITLDFAGRRVVEEENNVGKTMYSHQDAVVQQVQYGKRPQPRDGGPAPQGDTGQLVNPSIVQPAPQFVPSRQAGSGPAMAKWPGKPPSSNDSGKAKTRVGAGIIQDRELREMSDEGVCLSMHQPWASMLVAGIKIHEGRTWYTAHRGRLWIAATAKTPTSQEITDMEDHYRFQYQDHHMEFPGDYPEGCLLGCVDLVDCLSQEDYRTKFPDGESASPYVFICEYPQDLVIKFPIKGKHKIYKLDSAIHQAAKKGLR